MATKFTPGDVDAVARLALIPVTEDEKEELARGFSTVLDVLDTLQKIDTTNVESTHQVTGLENVYRQDVVDTSRMFTQEQALANAPRVQDGYFVVNQVIDQDG